MTIRRKHLYTRLCIGIFTLLWLASCRYEGPRDPASPEASTFKPTVPHLQDVGERLVGPITYTVDARSKELWMYFDFSQGSVVAIQNPKLDAWDLAIRRHVIRTNGGDTSPAGKSALVAVEGKNLAAVTEVPKDAAFIADIKTKQRLNSHNPVIHKWYHYSYAANVLAPKSLIYLVRTQDGKYAKMRIISYYCEGERAGCLTFEYVYQGNGSTNFAAPAAKGLATSTHAD